MLTVNEAADMLGLSKHQVYRRIARRDLPAQLVRDGTLKYLLPEGAVLAYQQASGAPAEVGNRSAMLRVTQVALMTGFTVETVRRMAYSGVLPYVRGVGKKGHLRIPREAVETYLAVRRRND